MHYKKVKSFNDFVDGIYSYETVVFKSLKIFLFVLFWLLIVTGIAKALLHLEPSQNNLIAGFNKEFFKDALTTLFSFFLIASLIKTNFYMMMGKIKKLSDVNLKILLWM